MRRVVEGWKGNDAQSEAQFTFTLHATDQYFIRSLQLGDKERSS